MKRYNLKNSRTGEEAACETILEIGAKDDVLHAHFICEHSCCYSAGCNYNDNLYEGDVVELFIYTGVPEHYIEVEVSPNNAHFLADITNDGKSFKGKLIERDYIQSSVKKTENGYETEIAIKLSDLGCDKETIRFNAFRIETDNGIPDRHLLALNPTLGPSFHIRDCVKTPLD